MSVTILSAETPDESSAYKIERIKWWSNGGNRIDNTCLHWEDKEETRVSFQLVRMMPTLSLEMCSRSGKAMGTSFWKVEMGPSADLIGVCIECSISNSLLACKYDALCSLGSQRMGTVFAVMYKVYQKELTTHLQNLWIPSKALSFSGLLVSKAIFVIPKCLRIAFGVSYLRESIGNLTSKLTCRLRKANNFIHVPKFLVCLICIQFPAVL